MMRRIFRGAFGPVVRDLISEQAAENCFRGGGVTPAAIKPSERALNAALKRCSTQGADQRCIPRQREALPKALRVPALRHPKREALFHPKTILAAG